MAEDANLHLRNVRRGIAALRAWGFIEETGAHVGKTGQIIVWQLVIPEGSQLVFDLGQSAQSGHRTPAKGDGHRHPLWAGKGGEEAPERVARKARKGGGRRHPEAPEEASLKPSSAQAVPDGPAKAPSNRQRKRNLRSDAPEDLDDEQKQQLAKWATEKQPWATPHLRLLVDQCLEHHRGAGITRLDWTATCRSWILKARGMGGVRPLGGARGEDTRTAADRAVSRLHGKDDDDA